MIGPEGLTLRTGYLHHEAAAPDETVTPLLPEGSRNEVSAGIGFQITEKLRANIGYQFIKQNDCRGRLRERLPGGNRWKTRTAACMSSGRTAPALR